MLLLHAFSRLIFFFFFNDTATTEIYTLSLHDALPISFLHPAMKKARQARAPVPIEHADSFRSEEHTSELQSRLHLVCRLLLEKKKTTKSFIQLPNLCYDATPRNRIVNENAYTYIILKT